MRRRISLVAALFVLLFFCLSTAGRCGLERMVNFGITLPLGEFAEKDKGLALTSGCLGAGLLYDLGAGVTLCGNFNYRHFGADLLPDSLGGSWQVLDLTGGLCPTRGKVGPHIPYLELGGGTFWPDLKVSTPMVDSILSYERSFGLYGGLGLKSGSRGGVAYKLAVRLYRFTIDEGNLAPRYEFFVVPPSEISGNFYYLTI